MSKKRVPRITSITLPDGRKKKLTPDPKPRAGGLHARYNSLLRVRGACDELGEAEPAALKEAATLLLDSHDKSVQLIGVRLCAIVAALEAP